MLLTKEGQSFREGHVEVIGKVQPGSSMLLSGKINLTLGKSIGIASVTRGKNFRDVIGSVAEGITSFHKQLSE